MSDSLKKAAVWASMSMFVIGTISLSSTFQVHAEDEYEDCTVGPEDPECEPLPCDQPTSLLDSAATPCTMAQGGKGRKKKKDHSCDPDGKGGCTLKGKCPDANPECRKGDESKGESKGCACRKKKDPDPDPSPSTKPSPTMSPSPDPTPEPTPSQVPTYY